MKEMFTKILFLAVFSMSFIAVAAPSKKEGEFYKIIVYHYTTSAQQNIIEQYLKDAYLPALHRQKIKNVGVFINLANDTANDKRLYVIFPVKSLQQVTEITGKLAKDNDYLASGKTYLDADFKSPAYTRMENILLKAFPMAPFLIAPKLNGPKLLRVYELRSYESPTEKLHINKVQMFNEGGEVALFKQLNFNAVFYGSVIAGSRMPNLMYMTTFENKMDRDNHWKAFGESPEWLKLKALPEYQNNVSKNEQNFLFPTLYSDY